MHKHGFVSEAFRKQRLPLLFLLMLPSFLVDCYIIFGLIMQLHSFPLPPQIGSFWDAAAPFAANFVLLKAPLMLRYSRVRLMRLGSYVRVGDNLVVYRKSKIRLFSKPESGYAHHDDYYFHNITGVRRKQNGALVADGTITVQRKQHGIEAVMREWKRSRMTIPAYFEDMDGIEAKLRQMSGQR